MERGRAFAVLPEGKILYSTQFNGDMLIEQGAGAGLAEAMKSVKAADDFTSAIEEFNKKHFSYDGQTVYEDERVKKDSTDAEYDLLDFTAAKEIAIADGKMTETGRVVTFRTAVMEPVTYSLIWADDCEYIVNLAGEDVTVKGHKGTELVVPSGKAAYITVDVDENNHEVDSITLI